MSRIFLVMTLGGALALAACSSAGTGGEGGANTAARGGAPGAGRTAGGQKAADGEIVRARSAKEVEVKAGGEADAEVRLDIAEGYHVNANPPTDKNLIGTTLTVAGGEGVAAGAPVYPPALMKKFEFDERPLAVYEGEAIIKLPLRAAASAARVQQTLQAKVRVQPCNDQACLPPRTIETAITVTVN